MIVFHHVVRRDALSLCCAGPAGSSNHRPLELYAPRILWPGFGGLENLAPGVQPSLQLLAGYSEHLSFSLPRTESAFSRKHSSQLARSEPSLRSLARLLVSSHLLRMLQAPGAPTERETKVTSRWNSRARRRSRKFCQSSYSKRRQNRSPGATKTAHDVEEGVQDLHHRCLH